MGLSREHLVEARATLTVIGQKTILSGLVYEGDPFVDRYVVKPGETLGEIARQFEVTADFLAAINEMRNKNLVRAGQTIKVPHGPFHAKVNRSAFRMDVYLQGTYVRSFPVGLGRPGHETPTGLWRVKQGGKLIKPAAKVFWGGYSGYFADPDGHLWEVAYNPYFKLGDDGRVELDM